MGVRREGVGYCIYRLVYGCIYGWLVGWHFRMAGVWFVVGFCQHSIQNPLLFIHQ